MSCKVKAVWRVGYPTGPNKKIFSPGDVFECDREWAEKKAANGKVEIIEEIGNNTGNLEKEVEKYNEGYGWYKLPGVDRSVRKEEALKILKEM